MRRWFDHHYEPDESESDSGSPPWPRYLRELTAGSVGVVVEWCDLGWDPEPLPWERFGRLMGRHWQSKVVTETKTLTELDAATHPLAVLTGTNALQLKAADKAALKKYVTSGGMILLEAAGGNIAFGDSAAEMIDELFEDADSVLRRMPPHADLYELKGMAIAKVAYRRAAMKRFGGRRTPRLEALMIGTRPGVILSREDLTSGLAGYSCATSVGYKPGTPAKPGSAEKIMRNIVLYSIQAGK